MIQASDSRWFIRAVLLVLCAGCGSGAETLTLSQFRVNHLSPASGSVVEDLHPVVLVIFSHPVDASTVDRTSVQLRSSAAVPMSGEVRVNPLSSTMIEFYPTAELAKGRSYEIVVQTSVRDVNGRALGEELHGRFAIAGDPPATTPGPSSPPPVAAPPAGEPVFYVEDCALPGSPGTPCVSAGPAEMASDGRTFGLAYAGVPDLWNTAPSPRLHQGSRVFLSVRQGTGNLPDGSSNQILVAVAPDRSWEIPIVGNAPAVGLHSPRWAKDESFLSYVATEWSSGGTPVCRIYKVPVTWGADGMPIPGKPSVSFSNSSILVNGSYIESILEYDWSPDGKGLVYVERKPTGAAAVPTVNAIWVSMGGTRTKLESGGDQRLACWQPGSGNWIAYANQDDVYVRTPDRSQLIHVTSGMRTLHGIAWSPNGNEIASLGPDTRSAVLSGEETARLGLWVIPVKEGNELEDLRRITEGGQGVLSLFGWCSQQES